MARWLSGLLVPVALCLLLAAPPAYGQHPFHVPGSPGDVRTARDALVYLLFSQASGVGVIDDPGVVEALLQFVNTQVSTFPAGTSSVGFACAYDSARNSVVPTSRNFGPLFAQRPLTGGRHRWAVALNLQRVPWVSVDGMDLRNSGLHFVEQNLDRGYYRQVFRSVWRTKLALTTTTAVVGATVGITDRFDVGLSVPFIETEVAGQSTRSAIDAARTPMPWENLQSAKVSARSRGAGDVVARAKWNFHRSSRGQYAVGGEIRFPTGREEEMLGSGRTGLRVAFMAATETSPLSFHANVAYAYAGRGIRFEEPGPVPGKVSPPLPGPAPNVYLRPDHYEQLFSDISVEPSSEFDYTVGSDVVVGRRVTLAADFIGTSLVNGARLVNVTFDVPLIGATLGGGTNQQPFLVPGARPLLLGVAGVKVNILTNTLATASLLVPVGTNGLTPGVSLNVGLEYAF